METRIWLNNRFTSINPNDFVKTTKAIHSFCVSNNMRDSIFKTQGGYYKLCKDGILVKVFNALNNITFNQLFEILKDK